MTVSSWARVFLRKIGSSYRVLLGHDSTSIRDFLARYYLQGEGLEIGALDKPMTVPKNVRVRYVDRMNHEDLLRQYPELVGKKLADIDIVTDGETLREVINASQDFVIANHFLEHCEDPITTLKNFLRVVKPGGILFVALPDKRYTFDRARPNTTYEHLLEDHRNGPEGSRQEHFYEWVKFVEGKEGTEAEAESYRLLTMKYSIHFHVFTGESMMGILERLCHEEDFEFEVRAYLQNGNEFLCILQKGKRDSIKIP